MCFWPWRFRRISPIARCGSASAGTQPRRKSTRFSRLGSLWRVRHGPDRKRAVLGREMVKVVFIERNGSRRELDAQPDTTLLRVAQAAGLDMEGACEGSMACSTCHVLVEPEWFAKL